MLWLSLIAGEVLLVLGSYRIYVWLRVYAFQSTTVRITRSEPVLIDGDDQLTGRYYPAIEFVYKAGGKLRKGTQHSFPAWNSSYDYDKVSSLCETFRVTSEYQGWFDPRHPSHVRLERAVDRRGLVYLLLAAIGLIWCQTHYHLTPPALAAVILSALALLFLFLSIEDIVRDAAELPRIEDPLLEECQAADVKGVDRKFLEQQLRELRDLGFSTVTEIRSRAYESFGYRNFMCVMVSADERTMATIGEVWYCRRLVGVIPLPFLGLKSVDFDSMFSNQMLVTTTQVGRVDEPRPHDCRRLRVPEHFSVDQMFEAHVHELDQTSSRGRLGVELFDKPEKCLEYIRLGMRKLLEYQLKQSQ